MKYSSLQLCLVYSFIAVCSAKEIEIGAVLQLDKDAIQKIAAVLQKPDNDTNSQKRYIDYLKEAITVMKSYDEEALSEIFNLITDGVRKMFEKENIKNTNILKDLDKVKHETKDKVRRRLLDETLLALEEKSDVGARRQNIIENVTKDFKTEDISSFVSYLNMFKHDSKRTDTKSRGFKKAINRMIKSTIVILKYLKEDIFKSKEQKNKKVKSHNQDEHTFEDKFEYDNKNEGFKMKLDHDYFVMDRLLEELGHDSDKNPFRTRPTSPPVSYVDEAVIVISQNEDSSETDVDSITSTPQWQHKHLKKDVLADFNIEVKKNKKEVSVQKKRIPDHKKDDESEETSSELLRQLFPLKSKDLRAIKLKAVSQNDADKEETSSELIAGKYLKHKSTNHKKASKTHPQRLHPGKQERKVVFLKKHKIEDSNNDDDNDKRSLILRGKGKNHKVTEFEKTSSEYIKSRVKKQKTSKIKDSLEIMKGKVKKQHSVRKKALSEMHRGKAKKQNNAEIKKTSSELLHELFPPGMKIMNVKVLRQKNGMPQEIHLQHNALIDVRNFKRESQKNEPD